VKWLFLESLEGKYNAGALGVDGKLILIRVIDKDDVGVKAGFNLLMR
jgi:hypothetical protein